MFDFLKDLNLLRPYIARRDKWKFVVLVGLMLVAACFELVGLGVVPLFLGMLVQPAKLAELPLIGGWFDGLPNQATTQMVVWASVILLSVYLIKNIVLVCIYYIQNIVVEDQRVKLSCRIFKAYQDAPYEWHLQRNSAEFIRNITQDPIIIIDQILMPFLAIIMSSVVSLAVVTFLLVSMPGIATLSILTVGVGIVGIIEGFRKILRRLGEIQKAERKQSVQMVMQGMGALVDSRLLRCEPYLLHGFHASVKRMARALRFQNTVISLGPYLIEILCIVGLLVVMFSLLLASDDFVSKIPLISLFAVSTVRLRQTFGVIAGAIQGINVARSSIPNIVEDLKAVDQLLLQKQQTRKPEKIIGAFQQLKLKGVTYHYPDTDTAAVKEINLELTRGESIAFVGTTGCGKSTLVNIILGFLEPQQGLVEVNGEDIQQDLKGWYASVGYIPQTIFLIDDTIWANVAFGLNREEIEEEQVWEALRTACLDDFIKSLKDGLDTVVGERGVRISGGQRQRLGIARALYRNPAVVVMDEATSALDNETEMAVMRAISNLRKDRTFIMIAHRLSTVEGCDRRYEMAEGRIVSLSNK
jgi:ABC-type multidrug transport system fused ATPase/permease subunit